MLSKVCIVKSMVFPVVMYGSESWTIKKTGCWRTDAFELWYWRRLLRVPLTARRSNQPILKEIDPEYSLEGLMLKLQYFGHLMWIASSLEKILILGKIEGRRTRGQQRTRWLDGITDSMDMTLRNSGRWWRTGKPGMLQSMGSQTVGQYWATEQQQWQFRGKYEIIINHYTNTGKIMKRICKQWCLGNIPWLIFLYQDPPLLP